MNTEVGTAIRQPKIYLSGLIYLFQKVSFKIDWLLTYTFKSNSEKIVNI